MFKSKKLISILLVISMLAGMGLFNASSIIAFAEEGSEEGFPTNGKGSFNPVFVDDDGNEINMNELNENYADEDSSYNAGDLPATYDARKDNLVTSVKKQNPYGTCWAHAAINCLEADAIKKGYYTKDNADFSESHLVWFAYNPISSSNSSSLNDGCDNVSDLKDAFNGGGNYYFELNALSRWEGIAKETDFIYPPTKALDESSRYNTGTNLVLDSLVKLSSNNLDEVKNWIMDHGSVWYCYYSSSGTNVSSSSAYNTSLGEEYFNHAVSIVGWNDNFSRDNFKLFSRPKSNGAWLIKNSWGTGAGDNGYYWISYETPAAYFGFSVAQKSNLLNNYTYNGAVYDTLTIKEFDAKAVSVANVFTAKEKETLSKVSFFSAQNDVTTAISIYKLNSSHKSPVEGSLVSTITKEIHNSGYQTVDLTKKVDLVKGQQFSVVISFTSNGSGEFANKVTIAKEGKRGFKNDDVVKYSKFSIEKGESWYCYSNDTWLDNYDEAIGNNYINAITESTSGSSTPVTPTIPDIKFTASPSTITVNEGSTSSVKLSYVKGDYLPTLSYYDYDKSMITPEWDKNWNSDATTDYINLNIKGLKAGTTSFKVKAYDGETGTLYGTVTINVTVKAKSTPTPSTPDYSKVKVTIRQPATTTIRQSLDGLYLHATAENLPEGAEIVWYIPDGNGTTVYGECVDCNVSGHPEGCHACYFEGKNPGTVTISAKLADAKGNYLQYNGKDISDSVEIKVEYTSFFLLFIDLILFIFGGIGRTYNA